MANIKFKWGLMLLAVILGSCATSYQLLVPTNRSELQQNRYGVYMELATSCQQLNGEFIGLSNDSLYLLTQERLVVVKHDSILGFRLILSRNKSDAYLKTTALATAPSVLGAIFNPDYASAFATVALVCGASGLLATVFESWRQPMVVEYPNDQKPLEFHQKYARFPAGLPEGITREMIEDAEWRK
jgi:hypothetical protein